MKKLKQEYLDKIDEIVAKHKDEKGPMKLMLHEIQNELGQNINTIYLFYVKIITKEILG